MRKIRIGNDIRLTLTIKPNENAEFYKINTFDQSSVKQLRCYLINVSGCRNEDDETKLKPFIRVGFPLFFKPEHHNINNAGFPSYHMMPANLHNYDRFAPDFHDFHWWPGFRGFGLHPERFHDHCPHLQHGPKPIPCEGFGCGCCCEDNIHQAYIPGFTHPEFPKHDSMPLPYDIYGRPIKDFMYQDPSGSVYLADSQVTEVENTITCLFPAVQQKLAGVYKLVVVLTVFEQGWGRHNLRTYTIDKGDVFELVCDETGESGDITIDVDDSGARVNFLDGIYVESDNYVMPTNEKLKIGEYDMHDNDYNIYAYLKDGGTVLYNPYDWHFNKLEFSSSDPELVSVDKFGTITSYDFDLDETEKSAVITVKDVDDELVFCQFTVTVKRLDTIKIGFDPQDQVMLMSANSRSLNAYSIKEGHYSIANTDSGNYLWVFSQRKIHYIKSVQDDEGIVSELSSGFRVPMMTAAQPKDGYFCYRSTSPILSGNMNIKIKFA